MGIIVFEIFQIVIVFMIIFQPYLKDKSISDLFFQLHLQSVIENELFRGVRNLIDGFHQWVDSFSPTASINYYSCIIFIDFQLLLVYFSF